MQIRFARSATKHRVSRRDSLTVIANSDRRAKVMPEEGTGWSEPRWAYVGVNGRGVAIEVFVVTLENEDLLVIHAMPLRAKTLKLFEGSGE